VDWEIDGAAARRALVEQLQRRRLRRFRAWLDVRRGAGFDAFHDGEGVPLFGLASRDEYAHAGAEPVRAFEGEFVRVHGRRGRARVFRARLFCC